MKTETTTNAKGQDLDQILSDLLTRNRARLAELKAELDACPASDNAFFVRLGGLFYLGADLTDDDRHQPTSRQHAYRLTHPNANAFAAEIRRRGGEAEVVTRIGAIVRDIADVRKTIAVLRAI